MSGEAGAAPLLALQDVSRVYGRGETRVVALDSVATSVLPYVTGAAGDSALLADLDRNRRARAITLRARYTNRLPPGATTP